MVVLARPRREQSGNRTWQSEEAGRVLESVRQANATIFRLACVRRRPSDSFRPAELSVGAHIFPSPSEPARRLPARSRDHSSASHVVSYTSDRYRADGAWRDVRFESLSSDWLSRAARHFAPDLLAQH